MLVTFKLYENGIPRQYSYDVPTLSNAFLPISYIDPRRIRPFTFHDFSNYTFEEAPDFNVDLQRLVQLANSSIKPKRIDRLKKIISSSLRSNEKYQEIISKIGTVKIVQDGDSKIIIN